MKRDYLGDSYDAVKRLWQQIFEGWAPLFAEPQFIPGDLRADFTRLTGIPVIGQRLPSAYSVLNDPDTGIRLPSQSNQTEGRSHVSVKKILKQLEDKRVKCVITFDQSRHRIPGYSAVEQRKAKLAALVERGAPSFYYVSHAPFLFAFQDAASMQEGAERISNAGVPMARLEGRDGA